MYGHDRDRHVVIHKNISPCFTGHGQVYLYENRYVSSVASAGRPDWVGCDHTDELPIISGLAFLDMPPSDDQRSNMYSNKDKKTSLDMMAYWANFARTGYVGKCSNKIVVCAVLVMTCSPKVCWRGTSVIHISLKIVDSLLVSVKYTRQSITALQRDFAFYHLF